MINWVPIQFLIIKHFPQLVCVSFYKPLIFGFGQFIPIFQILKLQ